MDELTIGELEERAGVPRRTIYFYVQQGLLPPPRGAGLAARYDRRHLERLAAIPLLRAAGWRLDRMRRYFSGASDSDVAAVLGGHVPGDAAPATYAHDLGPALASDLPGNIPGATARRQQDGGASRSIAESRAACPAASPPATPDDRPVLVERYRLAPGIELLIDRDVADNDRGRIAPLLALAGRLFGSTASAPDPASSSQSSDPPTSNLPCAPDVDSGRRDQAGGP
jgi:DNA-binding transcriptional MerR regulator